MRDVQELPQKKYKKQLQYFYFGGAKLFLSLGERNTQLWKSDQAEVASIADKGSLAQPENESRSWWRKQTERREWRETRLEGKTGEVTKECRSVGFIRRPLQENYVIAFMLLNDHSQNCVENGLEGADCRQESAGPEVATVKMERSSVWV